MGPEWPGRDNKGWLGDRYPSRAVHLAPGSLVWRAWHRAALGSGYAQGCLALTRLQAFEIEHKIDPHWLVGRAVADSARVLARGLGINSSSQEHEGSGQSMALVVLDAEGRVMVHTSATSQPDADFLAAVRAAIDQ